MLKKLAIIGAIAIGLAVAKVHPVNEDIVKEIRAKTKHWTPMEVAKNPLSKMTPEQITGLMGTKRGELQGYPAPQPIADLPTNYDARADPDVSACVHPIRNQAQCGSCWAFGASEALSDRFCIASKGKVSAVLSPEDLVSCNTKLNQGCNGGYLFAAWTYLENTGIVTDGCFPYTSLAGRVPQCPTTCKDGETFTKYKCASGSIVEATTPAQIQSGIMGSGPMETSFDVYADFMNYESGVYTHVSGALDGGHAVKILGWGEENGLNYWLCANSWGDSWGMDGFFKIAWGQCNIDNAVYACTPDYVNIEEATTTFPF
jgi:cathepsin B